MGRPLTRDAIVRRAARELPDGGFVNLGIGLPTLILEHIPPGRTVFFQSENGILGMGPPPPAGQEDRDIIDAGKRPVTLLPGASIFPSVESFAMFRGGHLDLAILGGLQVSSSGDLANWKVPDRALGGVGGAMDLAAGAKRVVVVMEHTTKSGEAKLVERCTYPLTARRCVSLVITDLAVIEIAHGEFVLREIAPGFTVEEIQERTQAKIRTGGSICEMDV
ncbi:MAG: CoA transferase subunit B [Candidatus Rokubacteria bacterium]|nr:CoA transferase subunit B [Candidatus Rokubacteria bacterium]